MDVILKIATYFRKWLELEQILGQFYSKTTAMLLVTWTSSHPPNLVLDSALLFPLWFYIPLCLPIFHIWFSDLLSAPAAFTVRFHSFQGLRLNPKPNLLFPLLTHPGDESSSWSQLSVFFSAKEFISWTIPTDDQRKGIQVININWLNQHNDLLNSQISEGFDHSWRIIF